jgi:hypothetical protein
MVIGKQEHPINAFLLFLRRLRATLHKKCASGKHNASAPYA